MDSSQGYVYVASSIDNTVSQYKINRDGTLSPLSPPKVGVDQGAGIVLANPHKPFLYVSTYASICQYQIAENGVLQPMKVVKAAGLEHIIGLYFSPDYRSAFAVNDGGGIFQFGVGTDGSLHPHVPARVEAGARPLIVRFDPHGRFAYITDEASVYQYKVSASGTLSSLPTARVLTDLDGPQDVSIDPTSRFAYVVNIRRNKVFEFKIGKDGSLLPLSVPIIVTGGLPGRVRFDPSGAVAFIPLSRSHSIAQYTVGRNGVLDQATSTAIKTGENPGELYILAQHRAAYLTNLNGHSVSQYRIGSKGTLLPFIKSQVEAGDAPEMMGFSDSGQYAYVVNSGGSISHPNGSIWQYKVSSTGELIPLSPRAITTGSGSYFLAVVPPTHR